MKPNLKVDFLPDKFGNKVKVGDTVVYVVSERCPRLRVGVVLGFTRLAGMKLFVMKNILHELGAKPEIPTAEDISKSIDEAYADKYALTDNAGQERVVKFLFK